MNKFTRTTDGPNRNTTRDNQLPDNNAWVRGQCPNGRTISSVSWSDIVEALRIQNSGQNSVMQDYNGDGKIDVSDIVYYLN